MTLKDLLSKHKKLQGSTTDSSNAARASRASNASSTDPRLSSGGPDLAHQALDNPLPEFTFLRTTTNTQEIIKPPHYPGDDEDYLARKVEEKKTPEKKRLSLFRNRSGTIPSRIPSGQSVGGTTSSTDNASIPAVPPIPALPTKSADGLAQPTRPDMKRKLSDRLHLSRGRSYTRPSDVSPNLPDNLEDPPEPTIAPLLEPDAKGKFKPAETKEAKAKREELWERRAFKLAMALHVPSTGPWGMAATSTSSNASGKPSAALNDKKQEDNIQEAIRLHEAGNLERSTAIFGRLADPKGANNPLSQVLYGLALRHGWGIEPSADLAILYLSLAARTSAQIQLTSTPNSPGDAKGELILAIFEIGNCFRFGWGCKIDKVAAKVFYEVAANLGDPDALEEAAWCCIEGFGGPKDKVSLISPSSLFFQAMFSSFPILVIATFPFSPYRYQTMREVWPARRAPISAASTAKGTNGPKSAFNPANNHISTNCGRTLALSAWFRRDPHTPNRNDSRYKRCTTCICHAPPAGSCSIYVQCWAAIWQPDLL